MERTKEFGNAYAVHAFGNGESILYGKGTALGPIYGPDYTSPSFGTLTTCPDGPAQSERLPHTNIWRHELEQDGAKSILLDAMDPGHNIFRRQVHAGFSFEMTYTPTAGVVSYFRSGYSVGEKSVDCAFHILPPGTNCFVADTLKTEHRMIFLACGCVQLSADGKRFLVTPGDGALTIVVTKPQHLDEDLAYALADIDVFAEDKAHWAAFLKRGARVADRIPAAHPEAQRIRAALEATAIGIKVQQSKQGGVMAGHYYPLAYVRDQAGVLRGLLHMGYWEEAKQILAFRYEKWKRYGDVYDAESMGNEDARLMFSNDEVEVPAYLVTGAFEYLDVTGDAAYVESVFDMLAWAATVQLKHLKHGMTGFSGDETYIAGHIFPRPFLYHGSAESTFLFIEGNRRILDFDKTRKLLDEQTRQRIQAATDEAERLYRSNFVLDGVLYGNNPERERYDTPPRYHYGYCQADELLGQPSPLTWLERGEDGVYRCPKCIGRSVQLPCAKDKRFLLGSVNLLPPYCHTTLFTKEELVRNARPYKELFEKTGYISSNIEGDRSLGYDFGLFLYNMVYLGETQLAQRALSLTLDMVDDAGMWAEYYQQGVPYNCRYRPWESAINIEAILYAVGCIQPKKFTEDR